MWASAASLSTLATYLKPAAPQAIAGALGAGVFQAVLELRRPLHLSPATVAYLQAFVQAQRNPVKVGSAFKLLSFAKPLLPGVLLGFTALEHTP